MAYTPEQYAAAGQFIQQNLGNPELIASTARSFNLSVDDLLKASQTVDPNLTAQDVTGYFQRSGIDYLPVTAPSPVEEAKSYWTEQTGDTSYGGLTDADIGAYIQANPTTYQSSLQQMAQDYQPQGALSTLTPTADVSLTPSGTGNVAPIGSLAYQQFTAPGGAGLTEMNRIISDYLGTSPTEVDVYNRMKQFGVEEEDIERATGKTLDMLYPELFRPGSVLSSGFGNVTKQLGGEGYYKGVPVPKFYDNSGEWGIDSADDQLARWKANIDKQDLSARAPFGFVETPIYATNTGDYDPYIIGYQSTPATAFDYLTQNNPAIANAVLGHTSTAANAYKIVNGELKEVGHDEITPEDIAEGNAFFMLAGATGGANRERMAQLYRADGDNLIPVGDPKMYKGAKEQDMGLAFLDMAASALSFVPGPWQIPAVAYKAVRGAMEGDWTAFAKAFLPPVVATAVNVYEAVESKDPFRIATSLLGSDVMPQVGSFDLGGGITVNDAVKAAKVVDAVNNGQYDVAAIIAGDLSNTPELSTAGTALRIKNLLDQGQFAAAASTAVNLGRTVDRLKNLTSEQLDIAGLTTAGQESLDAKQDLATKTFTAAKDAGATDAEATKAADVAVGLVANPRSVIQTDISGTPTGKDDFAGFDNALTYAQALASGALEFEGVEAAQKLQNAFKAGSLDYTNYDLAKLEAQLVGNQPTLEKAREAAETLYGKGASFNYNGKLYETSKPTSVATKATGFDNSIQDADIASRLNLGLDAADVRSMINEWNQSSETKRTQLLKNPAYAGIKAIYDEKASTKQLSPTEIASTIRAGASGSISATPESAWVGAGRDVAGGIQDVVTSVLGEPGNTASILNRAGGEMLQGFGGVLSTLGATNLGRELSLAGKTVEDIGESTSTTAEGRQAIIDDINNQSNFGQKLLAAGRSSRNNLGAVGDWIATEALQEGPGLLAFGLVKTGKAAAALLADGLETMGFAWNDARQEALDAGKSITEANRLADKAAYLSGATTLALSGALDDRSIKVLQDFKAGRITQDAAKEGIVGGLDEAATTAIVQAVASGKLDPNKIATAGVVGGLIEKGTSGTLSAVGQGAYEAPVATITGIDAPSAGANADLVSKLTTDLTSGGDPLATASTTIGQALGNNVSPQTVVASTMLGTLESGQSTGNAVSTVITAAIDNGLDLNSTVSSVVSTGIKTGADAAVVTDTAIKTALSEGGDPATIIASAVSGASGSPATVTTAVASSIATALSSGVDSNAAVKAATDAATQAGTSVQTDVKSDGSVITTTATDGNTSTTSTVDVNTGTSTTVSVTGDTTTQVDINSNSTVTTTVTSNSSTTTEIDNNTGVTTSTTITSNTVTDTVVDPNAATKTETKTDLTTGQTVTVVTNIKTNTQETLPGGGGDDTLVIPDTTVPGGGKIDTVPGGDKTDITLDDPTSPTIDTNFNTATTTTPKPTTSTPRSQAPATLLAAGVSGDLDRLLGKMLKSEVTGEKFIDPLAGLPKITEEAPMNNDPRLERYLDERGANPEDDYYSYGKVPSLDEILGGQVMAQGGQVMPLPFMYAKGGLSRQDFRQGKHVSGPGDGQSDDIPAMLADGEFVFPADVVAALGNGSTKAGTEKLYQMMHAIRQRARSTKVKDLPPPALKSPLDYLKSRK